MSCLIFLGGRWEERQELSVCLVFLGGRWEERQELSVLFNLPWWSLGRGTRVECLLSLPVRVLNGKRGNNSVSISSSCLFV